MCYDNTKKLFGETCLVETDCLIPAANGKFGFCLEFNGPINTINIK